MPLPGLLPISILMLTAVLAAWLGLAGPIELSKLEKWQPLIGAIITGAGILVASWNVTRQMRLTARSNEIDRIEKDLPGMRDAQWLMARIIVLEKKKNSDDASEILKRFRGVRISGIGIDIIKQIEEALPSTPDTLRREVVRKSYSLHSIATSLDFYGRRLADFQATPRHPKVPLTPTESAELDKLNRFVERNAAQLKSSIQEFTSFRLAILNKIQSSEIRLDKLRRALEKHID